jgi:hypothetical protein
VLLALARPVQVADQATDADPAHDVGDHVIGSRQRVVDAGDHRVDPQHPLLTQPRHPLQPLRGLPSRVLAPQPPG